MINIFTFYIYDNIDRLTKVEQAANSKVYNNQYTYDKNNNVNKITTTFSGVTKAAIKYTYDALGNIETITEGTTLKQKYYYDALNQLIREDNKDLNKTITYEYDTGGNILNKKEYAVFSWK